MTDKEKPRIDLSDPTLFGNDAAEDENQEVFESYFTPRDEVNHFLDEARPLAILRAYRGEGKSAVLRMAFQRLAESDHVSVTTTGASLAPDVSGADPSKWTQGWKRAIFDILAAEIGTRIGMAWSDDAMSLVEEAERNGFRSRSFFSSVLERIRFANVPKRKVIGSPNTEKLVQRWSSGRPLMWLLVDDIDENFTNTPEFRTKVASFFSACRQVVSLVPELRIRTGVRPNVWTIIRADAESLSKVGQYCLDLGWDIPMMRTLLARRVEGYLYRTDQESVLERVRALAPHRRDEAFIAMVFEEPMEWGFNKETRKPRYRPPHVVMATLSGHRPRWMIELAKLAAPHKKSAIITKSDITSVLDGFGRTRMNDVAAEYSSECAQIREIIAAFADGSEDYTTAELHTAIKTRVMQGVPVTLTSTGKVTRPTQIAAFLYEIGFLTARAEGEDESYTHYTFAEEPSLLHSRSNIDRGMTWEIHPVFRQALGLRTSSGAKRDTRRSRRS